VRRLSAPDVDCDMTWQTARYVRLAKTLYGCQFEMKIYLASYRVAKCDSDMGVSMNATSFTLASVHRGLKRLETGEGER
jgi:hypothetical protein